MYEYRVVWKREGQRKKTRKSRGAKLIQKWLYLLGDTPWKAFGKEPDDYLCCSGNPHLCACGGKTYGEQADEKKAEQPKIEYIKVEYREVGVWEQTNENDVLTGLTG
jgi:hypothetical protein